MIVTRVSDRRWLVDGRSVIPPLTADATLTVLEQALDAGGGVMPLSVEVRELDNTLHLVIRPDGSVAAAGAVTRALMRWLRPAGTLTPAPLLVTSPAPAAVAHLTVPDPAPMVRDLPGRLRDAVTAQDWEALTTHAFERSSLTAEARTMGVNAKTYTDALDRVRAAAASLTDGTVA